MAQTLKFGNKVWAAKEDSVLAYNDINNNYKPLPFDFARASIGTRVNKDGLIETMGQDIARIDYTDSADGVLLLEPSSTNLVTYSEDFSDAYWTKDGTVVTSNNAISPEGNLNADNLIEDSSNAVHLLVRNFTGSSGSSFTYRIFVKMNGRKKIMLRESGSTGYYVAFDLLNNTIIDQSNAIGTINKIGNDWFELTHTSVSGATFNIAYFILPDNYVSGQPQAYQGDGTSGFYIWGAMFEQSAFPTSYIPTSGSTVTRAAETCNNSGNSEVFNDSEGVLYAELFFNSKDNTSLMSINDGSTSNYVYVGYSSSSNVIRANIAPSGVNLLGNDIQVNTPYKISVKYKQNDFALWVNGFEVDSDNSGSIPSNLSVLEYSLADLLPFYGKTKEIGVYDTALTDAELETLTSYRNWVSMVNELNLNIIYNG